jgi:hypothetical protein
LLPFSFVVFIAISQGVGEKQFLREVEIAIFAKNHRLRFCPFFFAIFSAIRTDHWPESWILERAIFVKSTEFRSSMGDPQMLFGFSQKLLFANTL